MITSVDTHHVWAAQNGHGIGHMYEAKIHRDAA